MRVLYDLSYPVFHFLMAKWKLSYGRAHCLARCHRYDFSSPLPELWDRRPLSRCMHLCWPAETRLSEATSRTMNIWIQSDVYIVCSRGQRGTDLFVCIPRGLVSFRDAVCSQPADAEGEDIGSISSTAGPIHLREPHLVITAPADVQMTENTIHKTGGCNNNNPYANRTSKVENSSRYW